jgi:hypothetical protein
MNIAFCQLNIASLTAKDQITPYSRNRQTCQHQPGQLWQGTTVLLAMRPLTVS